MSKAIHQLLTDAVETSAIAYWAQGDDVKRETESPNYVTSFAVSDGAPDGSPVKEGSMTIDAAAVLAAREKMLSGEASVRRDLAAQFIGKPEDWDYDGDGIDALVQIAFFGNIAYG